MRRMTISLLATVGFLFCFTASSFAITGTAIRETPDTFTQGNWLSKYGVDGHFIPNGSQVVPTPDPLFSAGTALTWTYGTNTGSQRSLVDGNGDLASAWYGSRLTFDLDLGREPQKVALYLLDYDFRGRVEDVAVVDPADPQVEFDPQQRISGANFTSGIYLRWTLSGRVQIRITLISGPNVVASGIFFGTWGSDPFSINAYSSTDDSGVGATLPVGLLTQVKGISLPAGSYVVNAVVQIDNHSASPVVAICHIIAGDYPTGTYTFPGITSKTVVPGGEATIMLPVVATVRLASADKVGVYCFSSIGQASSARSFISAVAVQNLTQF